MNDEYWAEVRSNTAVSLAFNDRSFWLFFGVLYATAFLGFSTGNQLTLGLSIGAFLGAITGRASMLGAGMEAKK